jgi:4-oxalocrotonate tautomerase
MPHIVVKLWPGKSEEQKARLAEKIVKDAVEILEKPEAAFSVAFEEVEQSDWKEQVYDPEILPKLETLYKKPGYKM